MKAGHEVHATEGGVGEELAVPARAPPGRTPRRFGQKRVDQAEVKAVQDGAVVEEGVAKAALGMAGEFAVAEREVGRADGDVRNGERIGEGAEERCVAARDIGEGRARVE